MPRLRECRLYCRGHTFHIVEHLLLFLFLPLCIYVIDELYRGVSITRVSSAIGFKVYPLLGSDEARIVYESCANEDIGEKCSFLRVPAFNYLFNLCCTTINHTLHT